MYKKVDLTKQFSNRTIIRKYINSLPSKFMEFLTIMKLLILEKVIESTLDIEVSQKVKAWKRDQAYIMDIIEELRNKIYNLQVVQNRFKNPKPTTSAKPLQGIRE